jgi:hypothetical protein
VLLHAALTAKARRFTRQDGVEETWRVMQPLPTRPPPGTPVRAGLVGSGGSRGARRGLRPLARALDHAVTTADTQTEQTAAQSAAAPSPFPPIADYAFLSNCHTGALVAPDGAIDLALRPVLRCPERIRQSARPEAGFFRFGPFGINHPAGAGSTSRGRTSSSRPGKTPLRVDRHPRCADHGTVRPRGPGHTTHAPPADDDGDHMLVRTVECIAGSVEIELVCEPAFDYGRTPRTGGSSTGAATRPMRRVPADHSPPDRIWPWASRATASSAPRPRGRDRAYCALSWAEQLAAPEVRLRSEAGIAATVRFWRTWLKTARIPDHRWTDEIQRSASRSRV